MRDGDGRARCARRPSDARRRASTSRWTKEYDGFLFDADDPLLALVEAACRDAGVEPRRFRTGGGSDGNIFAGHGRAHARALVRDDERARHGRERCASSDLETLADLVEALAAARGGAE